eukprot:TRINITY_DN1306_c0_g1_i16.p1 TRINITY_DN1306_c0_g1~~TRINITY_DN1306_c0_g1_i16.p1  ORF type:complete len:210 (-),score=10.64 TRINITY_DN1306_c0_g1_i16:307-936(-)
MGLWEVLRSSFKRVASHLLGNSSVGYISIGPPTPFYIALTALDNQTIRRSLVGSERPFPSIKRRLRLQKWFRYRLATSSLFLNKSHVDPKKRGCHWCGEVEETSFHFFYLCHRMIPVIKAVEDIILEEFGVSLTPTDWLVSTSPTYEEAYEIEHLISTVQRALYASRTCGGGLPVGLQDLVRRSMEILRSIPRDVFKTNGSSPLQVQVD